MTNSIEWIWPEFNDGCHFYDVIRGKACAGMSLLDFYTAKYGSAASPRLWTARVKGSQVSVNGEVVTDPEHILRPGSKLDYFRKPWKEPAAPCKLIVLYEDAHLLVLHKPSGLQVLPGGAFHQRCVLTLLGRYRQDSSSLALAAPAHRLGRGTSGVLICAKHLTAKRALAQAFERATDAPDVQGCGTMRKVYRCLVTGCPVANQGIIDTPIGRMPLDGLMSGLYVASANGKPAKSQWRLVQRNATSSLLEVEIFTGRPHQIRIHMAAMGHPLLGDGLYCKGGLPQQVNAADGVCNTGNVMPGEAGYFLHSHSLQLLHPITNDQMIFVAPPPPELEVQDNCILGTAEPVAKDPYLPPASRAPESDGMEGLRYA